MISDSAADLGFDEGRLRRIRRVIADDVDGERYDGAAICVSRGGEIALFEAVGYADRASGRELVEDSVFLSMSLAKQLTVAVVLNRVERGDLSLTGRVADVIPEFGCLGKENVTLWQLLTHTAGLTFGPPPIEPTDLGDLAKVVAATCAMPVESRPGTVVNYSALVAHAVMAEMVRRVEGCERSFQQIVAEDLLEPLGMDDTALGKRRDLGERMCPVVARDRRPGLFQPELLEMLGALIGADWEVPAAGFLTTAADLDRFANMLRGGGTLEDARILSPATIDLATRNHTGDQPNRMWAYTEGMRGWQPFPANLGLGFFLRGEGLHPTMFGTLASPRTYGGLGAGSNVFWVDPVKDVTCVFLSTGLMEDSYSVERMQKVSDLVHAAIVD